MPVSFDFDYKNPDYVAVFNQRIAKLNRIRENPGSLPALKAYYKDHPSQFINDWGTTIDPRNVERGLPAVIPFILFPKQEEWIEWVVDNWRNRRRGITEKTRDMGMSWVSVSLACTMCLHFDGMAVGFGSRKEEYVDKLGAPKCLFYKARAFMANLPAEFRGGWNEKKDAPHMRINFPSTESNISGEAGENIGRGDRTSIYFVDEAAYLEQAESIEASLSATTNCRQDISSAHGMANVFAQNRHSGRMPVFTFHWRDDPRKDDAWYAKQKAEMDPVVLAQEVDIDYSASVEGILIPSAWVQASVDAHIKLGIPATGAKTGALDVADEGKDLNAFCGVHGVVVERVETWSGKGDDIFGTVQRAFSLCDTHGYSEFRYDADGLGAGVRGDSRVLNETRPLGKKLKVEVFRGSAEVHEPNKQMVKGRKNKDHFANAKAQSWWALRMRFQTTFRAVTEGVPCDPDDIISLSSKMKDLGQICVELSQPTYDYTATGKIKVDKAPDGTKSPNRADSIMIRFAPKRKPIRIGEADRNWMRGR